MFMTAGAFRAVAALEGGNRSMSSAAPADGHERDVANLTAGGASLEYPERRGEIEAIVASSASNRAC